ncbi:hypothetical protein PPL_00715 [Heterostelium album PN500]|uniref:Uncharacterized protein n=1 Tax=Heterostelium pallidum (strain ATCC 26659 / Pp 5 / PN500) TaxID=670386 RepID=D3AX84_HETP5|nr:hypothetical protein PPL_00715 [Heterostelium album PN500]EFA86153.1 hypothetical protein PPL_00715 [Heterostelium album PN500]|eukprot:XP_020438258.1 hypothetical protein PPL_00715 [Heterostelium album PN500]
MLRNVTWKEEDSSESSNSGFKVVVVGGSVIGSLFTNRSANSRPLYRFERRAQSDVELDKFAYKQYIASEEAIQSLPYVIRQKIRSYLEDMDDTYNHWAANKYRSKEWINSDIDLFLVCKESAESIAMLPQRIKRLVKEITDCIPVAYRLIKTDFSVTILPLYPYRPVQIVTSLLRAVSDQALFSDLDCNTLVYDPSANNIYTSIRGLKSIQYSVNYISPEFIKRARVKKYVERGFTAVCFESCKHYPRCDVKAVADARNQRRSEDSMRTSSASDDLYDSLEGKPYGQEIQDIQLVDDIIESKMDLYKPIDGLDDLVSKLSMPSTFQWRFQDKKLKKRCYQCEQALEDIPHPLCQACEYTNLAKLNQWDSISYFDDEDTIYKAGKYAIVTGARNKIGFQTALRLLRSGYHVLVTTRFPHTAYQNYISETDNCRWIGRLQIYGIDFRHLPSVNKFIQYVLKNIPRLHILINNAAQTIRRPRAYYQTIVEEESRLKKEVYKYIVVSSKENVNHLSLVPVNNRLLDSSEMSQIIVHKDDEEQENRKLFPEDMVDEHGDQLDMRSKTTWNNSIEEISMEEMLEVQLINVTVPFMLMSQLAPLMTTPTVSAKNTVKQIEDWSYIINVSSPEGSFQKDSFNLSSGYHVHTNMAKASLNMMTLSTSEQYIKKRIFVCAVDPGWITKMTTNAKPNGTEAPLSAQDGAARILDPIYSHINNHQTKHGILYKHFLPTQW